MLGDVLADVSPISYVEGSYRLSELVDVDVTLFEQFASEGDTLAATGAYDKAVCCWHRAADLYRGDLHAADDVNAVIERERLRSRYLNLLARLAELYHTTGDFSRSIEVALALLRADPCREDGHRLLMRAYTRRGERAQALRQYQLCERILRNEFDAAPEPATMELYDQVRLYPDTV
jgi:DNA-binding SARP family transcriptional activator